MLENIYITRSKIRQDILALFFVNPSQKYYLRELQRILGHSAGSMRRELLKFQKDNLFITERVGNLLYYSLNIKHPLFKEIKNIVSKTIGIEKILKKALYSIKNIDSAFIYGSFAAKHEKPTSDIDLMIIGNPDIYPLNEKIAEIEKKLKREINLTIYSEDEYKVKKDNNSSFIIDLLKRPKIMIIGNEDDL